MAVLEMRSHFTAGGTGPPPNEEIMLRLRYAMGLRGISPSISNGFPRTSERES